MAPGIAWKDRESLRAKWNRQGRTCAYCGGAFETIDHIIPLLRGGTNYEGNLAPCCRRCNSSKGSLLLHEWKRGRRTTSCSVLAEWSYPAVSKGRRRATKPKRWGEQVALSLCAECGALYLGKGSVCSTLCSSRKSARDSYRRRVGIDPSDPLLKTGRPRFLKDAA